MKPIRVSMHARRQMALRGADDDEVTETIRSAPWQVARLGRFRAQRRFAFGAPSPVNGIVYRAKEVEAVFADETDVIVVVTVKVYYSNEEREP